MLSTSEVVRKSYVGDLVKVTLDSGDGEEPMLSNGRDITLILSTVAFDDSPAVVRNVEWKFRASKGGRLGSLSQNSTLRVYVDGKLVDEYKRTAFISN